MSNRRTAAGAVAAVVCLVALACPADAVRAAKARTGVQLAAGARVALVNLLDAELTHFHAAQRVQDGFLKTYPLAWPVGAMLTATLQRPLEQLGLVAVPLPASEAVRHAREACFLDAALAKGLPKECRAPFAELAAAAHVDALIVLGPGINNSAHAAATRRRDLPEYLRGWCFVTSDGSPASTPGFLNLTELLLISVTAGAAELSAREWGGAVTRPWNGFTAPVDLKSIPAAQLDELQPVYAAMLSEQALGLLAQLSVAR